MPYSDTLTTLRFTTEDGIDLVGWLAEPASESDVAVVHVHGMSGNGFENPLLDALRSLNLAASRAFFTFNNRGAGIVTGLNSFKGASSLGGSCYEQFEDSAFDIEAAINAVQKAGYSRVILQGHSLGCTKVIHYLTTRADPRVKSTVLLAPTDMQRWATRTQSMRDGAVRALEMVSNGQGDQLVGETCWDNGPLSARVFNGYAQPGGPSDLYGTRAGRSLDLPMLVVYGTQDVGILEIDGDIETWQRRAAAAFPSQTQFAIIDAAGHGFREHLHQLAEIVGDFTETVA